MGLRLTLCCMYFFILNIIGIHACIFRVQSKVMPSNYVLGQLAHTNMHDAKNW